MTNEKLARANELKKNIDHFKWQLKYINAISENGAKLALRSGDCNLVDIPNDSTKEIILATLRGVYEVMLEKAEKEFDVL